jgi:hypothetical protein
MERVDQLIIKNSNTNDIVTLVVAVIILMLWVDAFCHRCRIFAQFQRLALSARDGLSEPDWSGKGGAFRVERICCF